jgi:hypothetical protein
MLRLRPVSLFLALILVLGVPRSGSCAGGEYRLEITGHDSAGGRPFEWQILLDRRVYRDIEFNPKKAMKAFFLEFRKALAVREGYHEKIYGKTFYKYVKVETMHYEIYEIRRRRVVLKGEN